ncbi:MAG: family transposase ISGob1 [Gemmataceae bacterium]|nr:family transposase ISGob1 [Gemmataceae bacterium]
MTRPPSIPADLWDTFPPAAQAIITALHDRITHLEARVADLEARLNQTSANSSRPPSADPPHAQPAPPRTPSGKRKGGQPGHPKAERTLLPPDVVVPLRPARRPPIDSVGSSLRSPCALLKIARFDKDRPVPLAQARDLLRAMRGELLSGGGWKAAYGRASEVLRDEAGHRPGQAFWGPTHLSYAFDGSATPGYRDLIGGRDLRTDQYASVPPGHLEVVFEADGGTHLFETEAAIWLYHVEEYFGGTDQSRSSGGV